MYGYDIIQLIDQFRSLKSDMCCALLEVFDRKQLVFVRVSRLVIMNISLRLRVTLARFSGTGLPSSSISMLSRAARR